jgi:proteasome accessory factor B
MYWLGVDAQQKELTVSRKSERLVNLTIALLATERWITKSEIYRTVDGYNGELDAKERMFERDKEDLRNLGIDIEVGTFDPLFEDEVGYKIRPEKYQLHLESLSSKQLALITSATQAWHGAVLNSQAASALAKLQSLGIKSDADGIPQLESSLKISDTNLVTSIDAIAAKQTLSFIYRSAEIENEQRALEPFGIGTKNGFWYLAGHDLDKSAIRLFRLDRVIGEIRVQGKVNSFTIPSDFAMNSLLASKDRDKKAIVDIRTNKGFRLRKNASVISTDTEWDRCEIAYAELSELVSDLLWHRDDAKLVEPQSAVEALLLCTSEISRRHV